MRKLQNGKWMADEDPPWASKIGDGILWTAYFVLFAGLVGIAAILIKEHGLAGIWDMAVLEVEKHAEPILIIIIVLCLTQPCKALWKKLDWGRDKNG